MQSIPIVATPTESIIMPNDSEYQMYNTIGFRNYRLKLSDKVAGFQNEDL